MISIALEIPERFIARVIYTLENLSLLLGVQIKIVKVADTADLIYTSKQPTIQTSGHLKIPFHPEYYSGETPFRRHVFTDGNLIWGPAGANNSEIDLIGSIFRILTLQDEAFIDENDKDQKGLLEISALPAERRDSREELFVENAVSSIQRLVSIRKSLKEVQLAKWPGNKKYAICLTHDTDSVHIGAFKEIVTNLSKYLLKGNPDFLELGKLGISNFGYKNIMTNPFFTLPSWTKYEPLTQVKQTFFVYNKPRKARLHVNDCKSSFDTKHMNWDLLKQLVEEGNEIGLHPSIYVKDKIEYYVQTKQWLESNLGSEVAGLRHHYWLIDWNKPHLSFRKQMNSGFKFDCSIAWQEVAGFRAGISHPYRPYDPIWEKGINIFEVPTAIMDGHITNSSESIAGAKQIIKSISLVGGVCVLDWHSESFINKFIYAGELDKLNKILSDHLEDSECWFTTPKEVVRHYHRRSQRLGVIYD